MTTSLLNPRIHNLLIAVGQGIGPRTVKFERKALFTNLAHRQHKCE